MAIGKPFTLYRRNQIYYVRFKLPDGRWSIAKSTGQTAKGRAEAWCIDYLRAGNIIQKENILFRNFTDGFFNWDGSWATDKRARGLRISPNHCLQRRDLLKNHLIPFLGDMKLTQINRDTIKSLRNHLYDQGYAGNTINQVLSALRSILEVAEEKSLIQSLPKIQRAAINIKVKGILTIEEVRHLFSIDWWDYRGRVGNILAACTGLRLGELQALTIKDINLVDKFIYVRRSYCKRSRSLNETTKTGRVRSIIIPRTVITDITKLIEINPWPIKDTTFLFFSMKSPDKPMEQIPFLRSLYQAMKDIGIDEESRRRRNITFHSWRHWFNSLLVNAKIPLQKVQSLTGHTTIEMSQHYYHLDDMEDVQQIQESIFPNHLETVNAATNNGSSNYIMDIHRSG